MLGIRILENDQNDAIANSKGNKFIIPLNFEMLDSACPITSLGSETNYVTKLHSTITGES